jgi:hypothetical protein
MNDQNRAGLPCRAGLADRLGKDWVRELLDLLG